MAPQRDRAAGGGSGLKDDAVDAALSQVGGRGQADRAGADDRNRQGREGGHGVGAARRNAEVHSHP